MISILDLIDLKYVAYQVETANKMLWSFVRSQRGAPLLIHSGFVYRCERKVANRTYWLCMQYKQQYKCNARIILEGNTLNKATEHNHPLDNRSNCENLEYKNLEDDDIDKWMKNR